MRQPNRPPQEYLDHLASQETLKGDREFLDSIQTRMPTEDEVATRQRQDDVEGQERAERFNLSKHSTSDTSEETEWWEGEVSFSYPQLDDVDVEGRYNRRLADEIVNDAIRAKRSAGQFKAPPTYGSSEDYMDASLDPPAPVISGLLYAGSNATLAAQYKVGKTTFGVNLVRDYADSDAFLNTYPIHPLDGRIAFWNYEMDPADMRELMRSRRIKNNDAWVALDLRGYTMKLHEPHAKEYAIAWLAERDVKFWILDPLFRAYEGDEASNYQGLVFTNALDEIKNRAGVSVLLALGHTGRAAEGDDVPDWKERMRGPTRFDDWPDERFVLLNRGGVRYFKVNDSRHAKPHECSLGFSGSDNRLWVSGGSRTEVAKENNVIAMLGVLMDGPVTGTGDKGLRAAMKGHIQGSNHNEQTDATSAECEAKGLIQVDRDNKPYVVSITDAGRSYYEKADKFSLGEGS